MPHNFYRGKEAEIVSGAANFASIVSSDFASLGLTLAQSIECAALSAALQAAYSLTIEPSTRTPVAVSEKNQAVRNMRGNAIGLGRIMYSIPTVTDAQLMALGLLRRPTRTRRPVPETPPVVQVMSVDGRLASIRLRDSDSARRGKPFGAASANLYSYVGPVAPTDTRQYHFERATTRTKTQILFPDHVASGATAWLSACWVSARGETGIASTPISFTIQGGAIRVAA